MIHVAKRESMKERTLEGFGARHNEIRLGTGLTQAELGEKVGVTQRVIACYEQEDAQPPGALLVDRARELKVSTDELLGVQPIRNRVSPKTARLRKRLRQVEDLPTPDQRAVLKFVDALVDSRGLRNGDGDQEDDSS